MTACENELKRGDGNRGNNSTRSGDLKEPDLPRLIPARNDSHRREEDCPVVKSHIGTNRFPVYKEVGVAGYHF